MFFPIKILRTVKFFVLSGAEEFFAVALTLSGKISEQIFS